MSTLDIIQVLTSQIDLKVTHCNDKVLGLIAHLFGGLILRGGLCGPFKLLNGLTV